MILVSLVVSAVASPTDLTTELVRAQPTFHWAHGPTAHELPTSFTAVQWVPGDARGDLLAIGRRAPILRVRADEALEVGPISVPRTGEGQLVSVRSVEGLLEVRVDGLPVWSGPSDAARLHLSVEASGPGAVFAEGLHPSQLLALTGVARGVRAPRPPADRLLFRRQDGHTGAVSALAVHPDDSLLASASDDGTVRLWDVATGLHLRAWSAEAARWVDVGFTADGRWLAAIDSRGVLHTWDVPGGGAVSTAALGAGARDLAVHPTLDLAAAVTSRGLDLVSLADGAVTHVDAARLREASWSPRGDRLLTTAGDGTAQLRDLDGSVHAALPRGEGPVTGMWSPDGTWVATADATGAARTWSADGSPQRVFGRHQERITVVSVSPDGAHLALASQDRTLSLWDAASGAFLDAVPLQTTTPGGPGIVAWIADAPHAEDLAWSPNGRRLVAGGVLGSLEAFTVTEQRRLEPTEELHGHHATVHDLAWTDAALFSGATDGEIRLWDGQGRPVLVLAAPTEGAPTPRFAPDGDHVLSAGSGRVPAVWKLSEARVQASLQGHRGRVRHQAVWSPDGSWLATASDDDTVRLWAPHTGRVLAVLEGHESDVTALARSDDGRWLLSGGADGQVLRWALDDLDTPTSLPGASVFVRDVAISPNGRLAAACGGFVSDPPELLVWDLETATLRHRLVGHRRYPTRVRFAPRTDGEPGWVLLSTADDQSLKIWDLDTGTVVHDLQGHHRTITALAVRGGRYATADGDGVVKVRDTATGGILLDVQTPARRGVDALVLTESHVYAGARDGVVRRWRVGTDTPDMVLAGHDGAITALAVTHDHLVSVGRDDRARLWRLDTGEEVRHTAVSRATSLAVDARGRVAVLGGDEALRWDLRTGRVRTLTAHTNGTTAVAITPDGQRIATAGFDRRVALWDGVGEPLADHRVHDGPVRGLAFTTDALVSAGGHLLATWSPRDGAPLASATSGAVLRTLVVEDVEVFTGDAEGQVTAWRLDDLAPTPRAAATEEIGGLAVARDQVVFTAGTGAHVVGPQGRRDDVGHTGFLADVAVSADGRVAVSAGRTLRVWDLVHGRQIRELTGHEGLVGAVDLWPDGQLALSGGVDGTLRTWDLRTGAERDRLEAGAAIHHVEIGPGGDRLLSATRDRRVQVWWRERRRPLTLMHGLDDAGELAWLIHDDRGVFDASTNGAALVAMGHGLRVFGVDQLALTHNRPDLLLAAHGLGSPALRAHLERLHRRRVAEAGVRTVDALATPEALPVATIHDIEVDGHTARVTWSATAADGLLGGRVFVNDVPIGPTRDMRGSHQRWVVDVPLIDGVAKVEVSAIDLRGRESPRGLRRIHHEDDRPATLHFLGFGVSDYAAPGLDLAYAVRDVEALADRLAALDGFDEVRVHTWLDDEVSPRAIRRAREVLAGAAPRDTVVIFVSGHGLRDEDGTWYYLTHDTDPERLEATAASYDLVEDLARDIAPLRKLVLLDTCESGELDPTETASLTRLAGARGLTARALSAPAASSRPWLDQRDRYAARDLARRTGAIVFSSSRGTELSYESPAVGHGLFTAAVLEALDGTADVDEDGQLTTDELRAFVRQRVSDASGGLQNPTVDRDNLAIRIAFPVGD